MILELKDEEILDFLMTSEFEENYKPEEFRYLLHKFRYFYRVVNGKYDLLKLDTGFKETTLQETIEGKNQKIDELLAEIANLNNTISQLSNRKLSLKERISGKIINEQ